MTSAQASEWTQIVPLLLWTNAGGGTHSFDDYLNWLVQVAFGQVRQVGERWLVADKPG